MSRHYHVFEVGCHLFQARDIFIGHLDESPGRFIAALGHNEPLIEARKGAI